jgi:hypothetical protein
MSRFKRRTLAAVVGLSLGWIAAGMTFSSAHAEGDTATAPAAAPMVEPEHAEKTVPIKPAETPASEALHDSMAADRVAPAKPAHGEAKLKAPPAAPAPHAIAAPHAAAGEPGEEAEELDSSGVETEESKVAQRLVPTSEDQISWYRPVLAIIVGLFVGAAIFGWLAVVAKGPPAPEPPDEDHGHDAKHDAGHGDHAATGHSH